MPASKGRKYWIGVIGRFENDNLSQAHFCTRQRLNIGTFRGWLYRLRSEGSSKKKAQPTFLEVTTSPSVPPSSRCVLRVDQFELEFQAAPSPIYLSELLTSLRLASQ